MFDHPSGKAAQRTGEPDAGKAVDEPFGGIEIIPLRPIPVIALIHVVIIMITLSERDERNPPTVMTGIGSSVRLGPPQVADRVNTKRGIQDKKGSSESGKQETSQSPGPAAVQYPHHEGKHQAGNDDGDIVTMLPHHDRVLFQFGGVFFVFVRVLPEEPSTMAVPESELGIIRVLFAVAPGVMANVI